MSGLARLETSVSQSLAAGPGLARRIALAQLGAGVVVALSAWLLAGPPAAAAGLAGAVAVVAGTLTMARLALGGGVQSGEAILLRLLVGAIGKWVVAAMVLLVALGLLRLPPLPAVVGVAMALFASAVAAIRKS